MPVEKEHIDKQSCNNNTRNYFEEKIPQIKQVDSRDFFYTKTALPLVEKTPK